MKFGALVLALLMSPCAALAGLTSAQINLVALTPPPDAHVPMGTSFTNLGGRRVTIGDAIAGRPTLLLPVDFTCTQICGPALSITASALGRTGLKPGQDYSLVVVGIDGNDSLDDARRFASGQVGGPGVSVLSGNDVAIRSLLTSIGYRFQRDAANDAIAHPAAYVTLTPEGKVSRPLSSLALQPTDLRLALLEAGGGRIGGLSGRISLLCYGFDAVHGIYTRKIATVLQIAGGATIAVIAGALALMSWRTARRREST